MEEKVHAAIRSSDGLVLVGDVGGTNSTFGVLQYKKGWKLLLSIHFNSKEVKRFIQPLNEVLGHLQKKHKITIQSSCFAGAGLVNQEKDFCQITHLPWTISAKEILDKTPLKSTIIINDFEAVGFGVDAIGPEHFSVLKKSKVKKGKEVKNATKAVLGAGTGLGKVVMAWNKEIGQYLPLPSEGGHADLVAQEEDEVAFLQWVKKQEEGAAWEDALSGKGLVNLYSFLKGQKKYKDTAYSQEINNSLTASLISKYRNKDQLCRDTFSLFNRFYAKCAKNFALDVLPFGGLFIAGGIAAKNKDIFGKNFAQEFVKSKQVKDVLQEIPVFVITTYDISLYGAAVAARLHQQGLI